jgi:hypothetical protein
MIACPDAIASNSALMSNISTCYQMFMRYSIVLRWLCVLMIAPTFSVSAQLVPITLPTGTELTYLVGVGCMPPGPPTPGLRNTYVVYVGQVMDIFADWQSCSGVALPQSLNLELSAKELPLRVVEAPGFPIRFSALAPANATVVSRTPLGQIQLLAPGSYFLCASTSLPSSYVGSISSPSFGSDASPCIQLTALAFASSAPIPTGGVGSIVVLALTLLVIVGFSRPYR